VACAGALLAAGRIDPAALTTTMQPVTLPVLPPVATVGVLVAALAAVTAPPARGGVR
jgi:hypothetical protein